MDNKLVGLIVVAILNLSIAILNEFMPFEQKQVRIREIKPKGEKGFFTATLVWLGIKKPCTSGDTRPKSHTSI